MIGATAGGVAAAATAAANEARITSSFASGNGNGLSCRVSNNFAASADIWKRLANAAGFDFKSKLFDEVMTRIGAADMAWRFGWLDDGTISTGLRLCAMGVEQPSAMAVAFRDSEQRANIVCYWTLFCNLFGLAYLLQQSPTILSALFHYAFVQTDRQHPIRWQSTVGTGAHQRWNCLTWFTVNFTWWRHHQRAVTIFAHLQMRHRLPIRIVVLSIPSGASVQLPHGLLCNRTGPPSLRFTQRILQVHVRCPIGALIVWGGNTADSAVLRYRPSADTIQQQQINGRMMIVAIRLRKKYLTSEQISKSARPHIVAEGQWPQTTERPLTFRLLRVRCTSMPRPAINRNTCSLGSTYAVRLNALLFSDKNATESRGSHIIQRCCLICGMV